MYTPKHFKMTNGKEHWREIWWKRTRVHCQYPITLMCIVHTTQLMANAKTKGETKNRERKTVKISRQIFVISLIPILAFPIISHIFNFVLNCANGEVKN